MRRPAVVAVIAVGLCAVTGAGAPAATVRATPKPAAAQPATPKRAAAKVRCHWRAATGTSRRRRICVRVRTRAPVRRPAAATSTAAPAAGQVAAAPTGAPAAPPVDAGGAATPTPTPTAVPAMARVQAATREFSIRLSRPTLAAGPATVELLNAGEDGHDLHIRPQDGGADVLAVAETAPGGVVDTDLTLPAGRYVVYCSLPGHEAAGMHALLTVT